MSSSCRNCGGRSFIERPDGRFCETCSIQAEVGDITSRLDFGQSQPCGTIIEVGLGAHGRSKVTANSGEVNKARAKKEIERLANAMKLSTVHATTAFRIYVHAQEKNFVQGRRSTNVMAVALYLACRLLKTPQLLIDFADFLGVDLFKLGQYYLKMVKLLSLQVPLIDPSLFIHRFCSKLNFEDKCQQVALTAIRIVKRMKRDWMSYGRRPSGLCGAAILIAARYHGFKRSTQQILKTVKVCNDTIRKRLEEFQSLPVAALTRDEFEALDIDNEGLGECDPPSFKPGQKNEEPVLALVQPPQAEELQIADEPSKDTCSDVDDEEIDDIILSPEESALKRILWNHINSEWLEKQRIREERKQTSPHKPHKRPAKPPMEEAHTPAEALVNSGKIPTNRIGPDDLERLFEHGETRRSKK